MVEDKKEHLTELEQDEQIDIYNLHKEYQKQPGLYDKWGRRKAKVSKEIFLLTEKLKMVKTQCKREVDEKKSELDLTIRTYYNDPDFWKKQIKKYPEQEETFSNFQIICEKKITEAMVTSFITLHPEYIEVQKEADKKTNRVILEIGESTEHLGILDTAVMTMVHKKAGIEGEINLWLGEYYADPKIPKSYIEQEEKKVQKKLRKRLKKD